MGPERRIRFVYATRNTAYHVQAEVCVRIDADQTRTRRASDSVLAMRLEGHVPPGGGSPKYGRPEIGSRLFFGDGKRWVITSPIREIRRPPREVAALYPKLEGSPQLV